MAGFGGRLNWTPVEKQLYKSLRKEGVGVAAATAMVNDQHRQFANWKKNNRCDE